MGEKRQKFFSFFLFLEIVILIQNQLCFWWLRCEVIPLICVKGTSNIETGTIKFQAVLAVKETQSSAAV